MTSSPSVLRPLCFGFLLLVVRRGFQGAHASRNPGNGFGEMGAFLPPVLVLVVHLDGPGEDGVLPAVAPEDVDLPFPRGHARLAVGLQQGRHSGPLVARRAVRLHLQNVEAGHGFQVVVAAADGVDEVVQRAHAVPAPGGDHRPLLLPHVGPVVVAEQVFAVGADLVVVAARDINEIAVDGTSVPVGKPESRGGDGGRRQRQGGGN